MPKRKIAIIGAGAIGSLFGAILARDGEDVTLIGNKSHMDVIKKNGLMVKGAMGDFKVDIKTAYKLDFSPDIAFISVKTQDVESVCREIKQYVQDVPVVMMQNGVYSSRVAAEIFGEDNIISCILLLNAQFLKPGQVSCMTKKPNIIGSLLKKNPDELEIVQSLLNRVAETTISDNILGAQWCKLFINALGNSLDGMTGMNLGQYVKYKGLLRIGVLILKEALRVVEASNIVMEELPGIPISLFKLMIKLPLPVAAFILKLAMSKKEDFEIMTSTLQSLKKGKKTEIDYLNGEFVKLARNNGLFAPYNSLVVKLIHGIEKNGSFYSPDELITRFSEI